MRRFSSICVLLTAITVTMVSCSDRGEGVTPCGSMEASGETGNESGMLWDISETADEIVNGIHLILSYDATTSSFSGTVENLNTTIAPQVRVEVHIFDSGNNSTEFGPTSPVDMSPGEKRNVILPITTGISFVRFNMHPEVGNSSGGEGSECGGGETGGG